MMGTTAPAPSPAALALAFVAELEKELTVAQWAEMMVKNASGKYTLACASHDYVDANMTMERAFVATALRGLEWGDASEDVDAWNEAWTLARTTLLTALPKMPPRHVRLARHALGLPNQSRQSYRNRFFTSAAGPDYEDWTLMVRVGWARKLPDRTGTGGAIERGPFELRMAGAKAALEAGEKLCPEDFPTASKGAAQ